MPGRKRKDIQPEDVGRWFRQGYGQGTLEHYKPWIRVQDFSSRGTSTKLPLVTVRRTAHLLSRLEFRIALFLDFLGFVFYEQYPFFPIFELQDLALTLGIRYPHYRYTKTPFVLTTDFLVVVNGPSGEPGHLAIEAKYLSEFRKNEKSPRRLARTLELLELKRRWLANQGVPQLIWTNESIDRVLFLNLKILNQVAHRGGLICQEENYGKFLDALSAVDWQDVPVADVMESVAARLHWPHENAFVLFKHLVWHRYINIDLSRLIDRRSAVRQLEIHWGEQARVPHSSAMLGRLMR